MAVLPYKTEHIFECAVQRLSHMSVVVSVQARLGSTRLPGKVLYELAGRRVLGWTVYRAQQAVGETEDIVVATSNEPENEAIRTFCRRIGTTVVTGPEDNLLERHLTVLDMGGYDRLIRLTADCPFVPSTEITRTLTHHEDGSAEYTYNDTRPGSHESMPIGTAVEVFDRSLLERLADSGADHPSRRIRDSPVEWSTSFTPNPEWLAFTGAHIAVDTPSDYWNLVGAVESVGTDPLRIVEYIKEN